jgi:hypothetical protein
MLHRPFIVTLLTIGCILSGMISAEAQQLTLARSAGSAGSPGNPIAGTGSGTLDVALTSANPTEGYVLAISYNNTQLTITGISTTGTATESNGAELVVPEILANGLTLGVVMDAAAPFNGQTIPAGTNLLLARITAASTIIIPQGDPDVTTTLAFTDGVLNNPPLDNIIVQGGLSIGAPALTLDDAGASLTITAPPPDSLTIESASAPADDTTPRPVGCARILLNNQSGAVQGFVLAISHDSGALTLRDINIDGTITDTVGAEFVATDILANGGTLGVVLDFNSPFGGQTIPIGSANHIANYCYSCNNPILYFTGEPVPPAQVTDLTFVDNTFGTPPLSNVIVVSGLSLSPAQVNGTFTCEPVEKLLEDTKFFCGPRSYEGTANPEANPAPAIEGAGGSDVEVCFFYCDPTDNLQGLQLAVCYDCNLTFQSFDITDSIFDEVGAEFVNWNIDDDPNDGDGCEFVAGILLDALPPFDGQTVPPTSVPLLIGCATVSIDPAAPCGTCLGIQFCDGINGAGNVLIENIAIIDFQSIQGFGTFPCQVCVVPDEIFQRGDCNSDDKVDLADAAKVLGWQFQGESIDCPDACDANDDGKINLADAVLLMNYLFQFGETPPDPGPATDGPDPTDDNLPECTSNDTVCP